MPAMPVCAKATLPPIRTVIRRLSDASATAAAPVQALGRRARRSGSRRTLGERGVPRRDLPLRCEPSNVGRMSSPRRPNARKPWTPDDTATLQRLAEAGIPSNLIADRLGRTIMSVSSQAEKLRLSIGKGKAARAVERKQARSFGDDDPPLR
jgi:hypothetical protein